MPVSDTIYSHAEIIASTEVAFKEVDDFLMTISQEDFLQDRGDKWSIAQNLDHLQKSTDPLVKALSLPKLTFRAFGKPNRPTRSYSELVNRYQEKLATIGPPPNNPYLASETDTFDKNSMQEKWKIALPKLIRGIEKWSEKELDKYLLPHPLLGKLITREMLFFTIYHTGHHLKAMKLRLAGE